MINISKLWIYNNNIAIRTCALTNTLAAVSLELYPLPRLELGHHDIVVHRSNALREHFILRALGKPLHSTRESAAVDHTVAAAGSALHIKVKHNCVLVGLLVANNIIQLTSISSDRNEADSVSQNFILYNRAIDSNPHVLDSDGGNLYGRRTVKMLYSTSSSQLIDTINETYLSKQNSSQCVGDGSVHAN